MLEGARGIRRTRAGLGSGLELVIPTHSWMKPAIWMNAPVAEPFVEDSPYVLRETAGGHAVANERDGHTYPVRIPDQPAWYGWETSRGTPMARIGVLQGTYLGIYVKPVCAFWNFSPSLNCRFCTTGAKACGPSLMVRAP